MYRTLDPATGELVERFETATDAQVATALDAAGSAFAAWRRSSFTDRARVLGAIADALEAGAADLGALMALEMGKPLAQGRAEAEKCAWVCRYYADHAERLLEPEARESDGSDSYVRFDPIGAVLAIMPWNFPFWQAFRFAAPALAAGNVVLLKHAPNTPRCALAIERLFADATDVPVLQNLFLTNEQAAALLSDPRVRAVTLTGSSAAGRAVSATAGKHLKPSVMELGGSDPFIVLDDADVERAAEVGVTSRCLNSGQSCIAAKRFLVADAVYEEFRTAFAERMGAQKVGPPMAEATDIGPLARQDLRDQLARQVDAALDAGATETCRGEMPQGDGFYFPPMVLEGVTSEMAAYREELFGPVAVLYRTASDDEAIALANDTPYGLGASVWTSDRERSDRFVSQLDTGSIFVNGLVKSDPRLPFGGVKESGFGRELSREGIHEFVNAKTVWHA
jgi:succinate-semialdehyde dehydrogenase/glutarate-semialdehyde dehydrogenase